MKILMIEDDQELCEIVSAQLKKENCETTVCHDGEEGLYYLLNGQFDVVILDRMLPSLTGIEILSQARAKGISTPVLLLTALGTVDDRVKGLESGADDYLVKPFDFRELMARLSALARRPVQMAPKNELCFGDLILDASSLVLQGGKARCSLSKKEAELLGTFIKNGGLTLPRSALFARVWGADADVDDASLDSYIYFLRRRLNKVSLGTKLVTVRGVGYRLEENENDS